MTSLSGASSPSSPPPRPPPETRSPPRVVTCASAGSDPGTGRCVTAGLQGSRTYPGRSGTDREGARAIRVTGPETSTPGDHGAARLSRRSVLKAGLLGGALLAMDACVPPGTGSTRYRPLGPPDANGLQLAPGFSSRIVARSGDPVGPSGYQLAPARRTADAASRRRAVGSTSPTASSTASGGVGMLRFDVAGLGRRRPPPARQHRPQLLGRPHPVGDLAVVRGGGQRSRLRGRPVRRAAAQGPQRHGPVPSTRVRPSMPSARSRT